MTDSFPNFWGVPFFSPGQRNKKELENGTIPVGNQSNSLGMAASSGCQTTSRLGSAVCLERICSVFREAGGMNDYNLQWTGYVEYILYYKFCAQQQSCIYSHLGGCVSLLLLMLGQCCSVFVFCFSSLAKHQHQSS